ncbi:MAG: cytochrome c oxidase subunit [Pseudomonadota bacterium]|jgi:cytochrome c oxidase subunit 2
MWWLSIANASSSFAPTAATKIAEDWDSLYMFLLVTSLIACVLIIAGMIYFVTKYRRKTDNDKTPYISHNTMLEFLWSFIPLVLFMIMFAWGWSIYHDMRSAPADAKEVHVYGQQWLWQFEYKNGKKLNNEMVVPVGEPIKLIMTSKDVLHSFYIPSFRIKQDVVPGRYTTLWFQAEKMGEFHIFCTEYCGIEHSGMLAKVKVVEPAEYEKWLAENDQLAGSPGAKIYNDKGCVACHSLDGSPKVGPSFKGLYGRKNVFEEGGELVADENYIRESIVNPTAKTVKGYPKGAMPSFQGQFSEEDLTAIIEFIKSQK